jgi:quercetin dioxygenase-like cupin family protein
MEDLLVAQNKLPKLFLKNIKDNFEYEDGAIIIRNILNEPGVSIAIFVIDKEQGLIEHAASADALVYVVEGEIAFTLTDEKYILKNGSLLRLSAGTPHSFIALDKSKMILIVLN